MIDRILSRAGVGFALLFMILELTYINAKSLNYMVQGLSVSDGIFSMIGAIAFSMVTVLIMRLSKRNWLKVVFPFFDMALVFCGFNLPYAEDLLGNPIRFALSIFLAVFTGLITYSLGQINAEQHDGSSINESKLKLDETIKRLNDSEKIKNETLKELDETIQRLNESLMKQKDSERTIDEINRTANDSKRLANDLLPNHILFLNWNNSKRKATNRNGHEAAISRFAERIKAGETITVDEYTKAVN